MTDATVYEREVKVYDENWECRDAEQLAELVRQGWRVDAVRWAKRSARDAIDLAIVSRPLTEGGA